MAVIASRISGREDRSVLYVCISEDRADPPYPRSNQLEAYAIIRSLDFSCHPLERAIFELYGASVFRFPNEAQKRHSPRLCTNAIAVALERNARIARFIR